uniref:Sodium/hydrogen exchanger n=1 Tax=Plectus sambesii TaxID=2011161 RepID=A0A914VU94_9BILA
MARKRKLSCLFIQLSLLFLVEIITCGYCENVSHIQISTHAAAKNDKDQKKAEKNYLAGFGELAKVSQPVSQSLPLDSHPQRSENEGKTMKQKDDHNMAFDTGSLAKTDASNAHGGVHHDDYEKPTRYQIVKFKWREVQLPYTIAIWILLASLAKIGFRMNKRFSEIFPDSSLLILIGLVVGILLSAILHFEPNTFSLDSHAFFLYLLPPIVFDAGYFMPNRAFFDNLGSILTFAVVGTVWNMITIGISLWLVSLTGLFTAATPLLHILLFSSLISAVDPVAVIVVFEEIHVNELLFITVFGESLLNDAVTVVLYEIFKSFSAIGSENLKVIDYAAGGISFFTVAFGGVLIGLIWAFIVSFTTKYTKKVKVLNPVFVFVMPYCAYLTAEMFGLSAIMAIVFCGIAMKQYIKLNISTKAITSIKYFTKMLSGMSETVIFMFLGLSTIRKHHWDIPFILLTVIFCLVYRTLGVIWQSYLLNKYRLVPYSKVDQFVIAYGGLRGAIAFGLVVALPDSIPAKELFITATIVVIYFTVFLQGITMKPLVNWLKVELDDHRLKTMAEHILEKQLDFLMVGLEDICGVRGHHRLRETFDQFNLRWLRPLLVREKSAKEQGSKLVREFTRLKLRDAVNLARGKGSAAADILPRSRNDDIDEPESGPAYSNPIFAPPPQPAREKQLDIDQILPKKNFFYLRQKDDILSSANLSEMEQEDRVKELNQIGLRNIYMRKRSKSVPSHTVLDSKGMREALQKANEQATFAIGEREEEDDDITDQEQSATNAQPMPVRQPRRLKIPEIKIDIAPPEE